LGEPPQQLYNDWVESRLEYYKRVEPTAAPRDVALEVDPDHTQRLKFSCQNGNANVSNAIWSVLLSNPDLEGLRKINELAANRVQPAWARDLERGCKRNWWPGSVLHQRHHPDLQTPSVQIALVAHHAKGQDRGQTAGMPAHSVEKGDLPVAASVILYCTSFL